MRVAAVSGDLLVKLAVGAAVVGALAYATKKGLALVPALPDAINITSENNAAASGVNALGHAIATADGAGSSADGSWHLGAAVFDMLHPTTSAAVAAMSGPIAAPDASADNPLISNGTNFGLF